MTDSLYRQAKELQHLAGTFLKEGSELALTDIQDWTAMQTKLTGCIEQLVNEKGSTPEEEAERVLGLLMGYTVAIRSMHQVQQTLEDAERVLPEVSDPILKCHLLVFCYGVCYDDKLGEEAHRLLEEQKQAGRTDEIVFVEELLKGMEEGLAD